MRKRDRLAISKKLSKIQQDLARYGTGQLDGSVWYFDNDAVIKGYAFAKAALYNIDEASKNLTELLEKLKSKC